MPNNQFLRGLILVLCAQIPLLAFFIYLLFLGVGISEFSNLTDARHPDPKKMIGMMESRDKKLQDQIFAEVKSINQRINQMKTSLGDLTESGHAWNKFVADGGHNDTTQINQIKTSLSDIESRFRQISSIVNGQMSSIDSRLKTVKSTVNQQLSSLESKFSSVDQRLLTIQEQATQLDAQYSALEKDIKILRDRYASLEDNISSLGTSISGDVQQLFDNFKALNAQLTVQEGPAPQQQPPSLDDLLKRHASLFAPSPKRKPVAELKFAANDWKLDRSATRALNKVIARVRKSTNPVNIGVYGFTVKNGPLNFSMALADKRARVVAELIRDAGLTKDPITIFVVPEYNAYRDAVSQSTGDANRDDKNHAVHIYINEK